MGKLSAWKSPRCHLADHTTHPIRQNKMIARFLHPTVIKKIGFIKGTRIEEQIRHRFDAESADWLMEEIRLNRLSPMPPAQTCEGFWRSVGNSTHKHDPRGTPAFVKFLDSKWDGRHPLEFEPHPNCQGCDSTCVSTVFDGNGVGVPTSNVVGTQAEARAVPLVWVLGPMLGMALAVSVTVWLRHWLNRAELEDNSSLATGCLIMR